MTNQLTIVQPGELMRQSTDVAGVCKEIVVASAKKIGDRNFVPVEGWMAIATAHGCIASAKDVEWVPERDGACAGFKAVGEVRRISDGALVSQGEGFVGSDEATWFGGESLVWDKKARQKIKAMLPKRPDYAIRAMAQTRAISRACRSAFAHIVVLMNAGLSTTPAEEVPHDGFDNDPQPMAPEKEETTELKDWRSVEIHFGQNKGKRLQELNKKSIEWYKNSMQEKVDGKGKYPANADDRRLLAACIMALEGSTQKVEPPRPVVRPEDTFDPGCSSKQQLLELIEFNGHTGDDLISVARKSKWTKANFYDDITDTEAAEMFKNSDMVLDAIKTMKGAK